MRKEIEEKLALLRIEAKEARKESLRRILIIIFIDVVLFLIPYYYPQFGFIWSIFVIVFILGGVVILSDIGALYQPLRKEVYAFQKFARAIEILEKSKELVAYEEAHRCLNKAYKILNDVELNNVE